MLILTVKYVVNNVSCRIVNNLESKSGGFGHPLFILKRFSCFVISKDMTWDIRTFERASMKLILGLSSYYFKG